MALAGLAFAVGVVLGVTVGAYATWVIGGLYRRPAGDPTIPDPQLQSLNQAVDRVERLAAPPEAP